MRIGVPLALALIALVLVVLARRLEAYSSSPYPVVRTVPYRAPGVPACSRPSAPLAVERVPVAFALRPGETLSAVLGDLGLDPPEASEAARAVARYADLRRLRPGDPYLAVFGPAERLEEFELTVADKGRVQLARLDDRSWDCSWRPFERTVQLRAVQGTLEQGSLEQSIRTAGGDPILAYRMADVLQWDLDFNRDLRAGDGFELVFEEVHLDGRVSGVGQVLALAYDTSGRRLEAFRYGEEGGYYDAEGRALRKMFLRSPLPYSRITSRFSHRRFHPVLKRYRPHYGVDYGAPVGTPVRVTASGRVTFAGWDRGGGNTVKVSHSGGYLTAYLHLSRFAQGIRSGRRVSQGEVIGYVGATGLATAAHLDYRVQHRGRWIDPASLKSGPADPISPSAMPEFVAWRDTLRQELEQAAPRGGDGIPAGGTRLASSWDADPGAAQSFGR